MEDNIQAGVVRCKTCGGFNGTTSGKYSALFPIVFHTNPDDPAASVRVVCRCSHKLARVLAGDWASELPGRGDLCRFKLHDGRIVAISDILVSPTYGCLLLGAPDSDYDAELILRARKRVTALWGERPTHLIEPRYIVGARGTRWMPPVKYCAWLMSGELPGAMESMSQLVVIWFGGREPGISLSEIAARALRGLQWERLAGGCDP